jgi:epoxyqueuosine reductase
VTGAALAARAKSLSREAGFDLAGVARADAPPDLAFFAEWVGRGRRRDVYPSARSPGDDQARRFGLSRFFAFTHDTPHLSTAAPAARGWIQLRLGDDYHDVMKPVHRVVSWWADTGPRGPGLPWTRPRRREGLAWRRPSGESRFHPEHGLVLPRRDRHGLDLPGRARPDTRLLHRAPRGLPDGALVAPTSWTRRGISHLTIEVKGQRGGEWRGRHAPAATSPDARTGGADTRRRLEPRRERGLTSPSWPGEEAFGERFRRSPVKRAKRRGLLRNVALAIGNAGGAGDRPALERLAGDEDPVVREHAAWGLRRLDERLSSGAGSS